MQKLSPWLDIPEDTHFSIYNLPYGIFSTSSKSPRAGVAFADQILDLYEVSQTGLFDGLGIDPQIFLSETLNDFISLGKKTTKEVRTRLQQSLCDESSPLKENAIVFVRQTAATLHLPVNIGDYTDFYSSLEHATNVGKMFRDPENALLPNWKHLPVGYHGRSSSIVVSGTDIRRPKGQTRPTENDPVFGPTQKLDFELEMAFIIGKESKLGESVSADVAEEFIFGLLLFNDWSARDIQKWEYVPLGPFLGKNFASSVSPWVVPFEALEPFRTNGPEQQPPPLSYLRTGGSRNFDIGLRVSIQPENSDEETIVTDTNFKYMYWNMAQQLAHHTVNGCNVRVGDMMASGTISGKKKTSYGSMLELSWGGTQPIKLNNGEKRTFLEDGDTIIMRAFAQNEHIRVGFGEVRTKILPVNS